MPSGAPFWMPSVVNGLRAVEPCAPITVALPTTRYWPGARLVAADRSIVL